ncbi:sulfite reductase subunit C [Fusobacterium ulcerans]|jgi:anaerobic sulfite reductase subunit C|uniref:sulfite reductase subunit C n=1 Tax=Fusobacterium TaxID=848 RepID=UPI000E49424C|nr:MULTISPECIES: sulfite reductase subunit C [Fusobacterium]MDH6457952.1 anaerobic sulfite reductase subunit C [Fusobacterium sp. PH5-7]RGY66539.1 sulfite reductase subunit C [Fusobacterium ulcerans]HJH06714.1 sulfite reductase subunit C [Fusobacterium ulcerans]
MDINTKKLKKNAFRVSKVRGITASRIRVPGGYLKAELLEKIQEISQKYGNGIIHITTRQGFEIEGIHYEDMDKVNELLQPIIEVLEINQTIPGTGYSASGTRNVSACIGNNVCPFANYNTSEFAQKIDKAIFPNDLHFKVGLTGCSNDCGKARMHDFGIIGMTEPQYDPDRCVNCQACVKGCKSLSVNALSVENYKIVRNTEKCIGCGVCITKCPTRAFTRSKEKYYKLTLMGRTGKKNPRLGEDFLIWVDADTIIKVILNTYDYVKEHISKDAPGGKEHIGYIIDRTGFEEYKKWVLKDIELGPKAIKKDRIYWSGIHFDKF